MNLMTQEYRNKLNNQQGIAILMVMSAVVLLTTIMLSFGIDTSVNKIRTYNLEDKAQAKLTAESGIRFAMARLRLYKAGYNYIQNNESLKKIAKPEILNTLWNFPFIYPVPILKTMNKIQKDAIEKFKSETLLSGSMRLNIGNISNKLNLNAIRVALFNQNQNEVKKDANGEPIEEEEPNADYNIESQLFKNFQSAFDNKVQNDEEFNDKYSGTEIQELISVLKTFVSDEDSLEDAGSVRSYFSKAEVTPKHAPLSSMQEMYSVPGWDDALVDLIKNEFTVHGAIMIDLNKITENMMRLLIPGITDEEIKDFFEYKNDPEDPKFFNSITDFKKYITSIGNIMSDEDFEKLIEEFSKNNIKFGASPSLFKITSVGEKGRASYTLEAYVVMPAKPSYKVPPKDPVDESNLSEAEKKKLADERKKAADDAKDDKEPMVLLMEPRIVEIYAK
jgi:hypothetical protein